MNTGFICRNTNTVARLVVRVVESPDALSNMSMQKERLSFLTMSVSVTTRIAVAIIIHPKNILNNVTGTPSFKGTGWDSYKK